MSNLKKTKRVLLRYTGYLNSIKTPYKAIFIVHWMCFSISYDIVITKIHSTLGYFDFKIVKFPFFMVILLGLHQTEFIFLNLSDLLDHLVMLLTSTLQ